MAVRATGEEVHPSFAGVPFASTSDGPQSGDFTVFLGRESGYEKPLPKSVYGGGHFGYVLAARRGRCRR